jgi:hypothetical protein
MNDDVPAGRDTWSTGQTQDLNRMLLGVVHHERSIIIDLCTSKNRTDAIRQFIQPSLLADPGHDHSICRNAFTYTARVTVM